jgi:intracellular sulfur oxidation DsrE/DsrF family protein
MTVGGDFPARDLKGDNAFVGAGQDRGARRRSGARMTAKCIGILALAALAGAGWLSPGATQAQSTATATQRARVVIQVSDADPGKWNLALNNAKNIQTDLGAANVDVEIVTYGPGIDMLKLDSAVGGRVGEATKAGVKVIACENTMRGQKLTKADMLNGIAYVPAGVVELMSKQQQGWAYIRP